jgi:hypothetical protein
VRDVGHALIGHHAEDVLVDEVADLDDIGPLLEAVYQPV